MITKIQPKALVPLVKARTPEIQVIPKRGRNMAEALTAVLRVRTCETQYPVHDDTIT